MNVELVEKPESRSVEETRRQTILIIDDDQSMVEVLSFRLKRQGYDVCSSTFGREGLGLARSDHPDLILLDLRLPDTDGLTVCRELADSPATCCIPVIILSGLDQPDILRNCRAAGCLYFVHKPYDPNALLVLIEQAITDTADWNPRPE